MLLLIYTYSTTATSSSSSSSSSTTTTTTTTTSIALPAQCTSATVINDPTRNYNYALGSNSPNCDTQTLGSSSAWFRFIGSGGTVIANQTTRQNYCGTSAGGYYTGAYPSTVGGNVTGTLCYFYTYGCQWINSLTVTNCNGYYVYYITLPSPLCALAVCTM